MRRWCWSGPWRSVRDGVGSGPGLSVTGPPRARTVGAARAFPSCMRLLLLLCLGLVACSPSLRNDDDDATGDDDDATGDDDDSVGDDDDSVGDDDDSVDAVAIDFGSSFGECWGECRSLLSVDVDGRASFRTFGWENETYIDRTGLLSSWAATTLVDVNAAVDFDELEAVYGCPDCADGGAREITWDLGSLARVTSYEYGNPPDLLEALVEVLTGMEQEIRTCAFGTWFSSIPDCEPVPGTEPD